MRDKTLCAGRAGSALALLAPHETAYVEFLRLRRVPLAEQDAAATLRELPDLTAEVRVLAEADRDVMEKGTRAFVSWVSLRLTPVCTMRRRSPWHLTNVANRLARCVSLTRDSDV